MSGTSRAVIKSFAVAFLGLAGWCLTPAASAASGELPAAVVAPRQAVILHLVAQDALYHVRTRGMSCKTGEEQREAGQSLTRFLAAPEPVLDAWLGLVLGDATRDDP